MTRKVDRQAGAHLTPGVDRVEHGSVGRVPELPSLSESTSGKRERKRGGVAGAAHENIRRTTRNMVVTSIDPLAVFQSCEREREHVNREKARQTARGSIRNGHNHVHVTSAVLKNFQQENIRGATCTTTSW